MADYKLMIRNGTKVYEPIVKEGITWETARKGTPGRLEFEVVKDEHINFQEGNLVTFTMKDKNVFYGYVFTKKRDKDQLIKVTAYDQLRYLKNKDTYNYENKTAGDLVRMLAKDFKLITGTIVNTGYVIASRIEDNKTLFDIIQNALDLTLQNKGKMYVLYDDFGKITLKDMESMRLNILINEQTAENFDYTSSIDSDTYNKIKLAYDNEKTGKREVYVVEDSSKMAAWGVLQYYEKINEKTNGKAKADALISLYNKKRRSLSVSNAIGDIRVRGGSLLPVNLLVGDIEVKNYMIVESVKHTFNDSEHVMDMNLIGGEFIA